MTTASPRSFEPAPPPPPDSKTPKRPRSSAAQDQRDPFADDVLERLIKSNQDYQREHGHYIVPLAERLLAARAEIERLREQVNSGRLGRERAEGLPEGTLPRV